MEDFDEDPLDLLEDDGDGVIEMDLFFDEDKQSGNKPPGGGGCCIAGYGHFNFNGWLGYCEMDCLIDNFLAPGLAYDFERSPSMHKQDMDQE